MPRIRVQKSLPTHHKTFELADRLGVQPVQAVGHLIGWWVWVADQMPTGDLSHVGDRAIARSAGWDGVAGVFVNALTASGFLDQDRHLHNWHQHFGKRWEDHKQTTDWARERRRVLPEVLLRDGMVCRICGQPVAENELTLDHIRAQSRGGNHGVSNLQVAHRACNSRKGAR